MEIKRNGIAKGKYDATVAADQAVIARESEVTATHGVPRAHVSLAWMMQKAPVVAP